MTTKTEARITKTVGIAGQLELAVSWPNEDRTTLYFVGTTYGAPGVVHMAFGGRESLNWTRVESPERFGERFGRAWVERFVAAGENV